MTEIKIPRQADEMDEALSEWESAIDNFCAKQYEYAELDSIHKAYEASAKKTYMESGMSATKAETEVRAKDEWLEAMKDLNLKMIEAERYKRLCRLAEAKWETARSKYASLRSLK